MKRLLLILSCLVLLVFAGLYTALATPILSTWLLSKIIEKNVYNARIHSLVIGRQQFHFTDSITIHDLDLILENEGREYRFTLPYLECQGLRTLLGRQKILMVEFSRAALDSSAAKVTEIGGKILYASEDQSMNINGSLFAESAILNAFVLTGVAVDFVGDDRQLQFKDLKADAYGGRIAGEALLNYQEDFTYTVELQLDHLDLYALAKFNEAVFSQVEGKISGDIRVNGIREQVHGVDIQGQIVEGGRLKASALGLVVQYIPQSQEKEQLEFLIKTGGKVGVEVAAFRLRNLSENKLAGLMKITSKELNLDLNLPLDINVDGNLNSVLKYWGTLSR